MKRLLTTTAITLLASLGAAQAGDQIVINQDFDIDDPQLVLNEIYGSAGIRDAAQEGTNVANLIEWIDGLTENGAFNGDDYDIDQEFDEVQKVKNKANTYFGSIEVDQSGTNVANVVDLTDELSGSTNGDRYDIHQDFDDARQVVKNDIGYYNAPKDIIDSSQDGTNIANLVSLRDVGGGSADGNEIDIDQHVNFDGYPSQQLVENYARLDDDILDLDNDGSGLAQSGLNAINLVDLDLTDQSGDNTLEIDQKVARRFSQDIDNYIGGNGPVGDNGHGLSQEGTNVANLVNFTALSGSGTLSPVWSETINQDLPDSFNQQVHNYISLGGVVDGATQVGANLGNLVTFNSGDNGS